MIEESLQPATVEMSTKLNIQNRSRLTQQHRSTLVTINRPKLTKKNQSTHIHRSGRMTTPTHYRRLHQTKDAYRRDKLPIDRHSTQQRSRKQASTDTAYYKLIDTEFNHVRDGEYSIGSWADEHHHESHESFAVEIATHTPRADKVFTDEELLDMQKRDHTYQIPAEAAWERTISIDTHHKISIDNCPRQSIDFNNTTSIDNHPIPKTTASEKKTTKEFYDTAGVIENSFNQQSRHTTHPSINKDVPTIARQLEFSRRAYDHYGNRKFYWEEKDEYVVYRDDREFARDIDGRTIPDRNKEAFQMKLDGVYYPLNDSWLTTCMDIARIQNATDAARPISIDRRQQQSIGSRHSPTIDKHHHTSIDNRFAAPIDNNPLRPHTMKSKPDFNTGEEIDQLVEGIYIALETIKERLDGRCDDIYFPMNLTISALTSKVEAIQGGLVESYIARQPEESISIDRRNNKSIDTNNPTSIDSDTNRGRLVPKMTSDTSNTPYHDKEISADTYAALTRHQFKLESLGQRLQRIENTTAAMKDKWCRGDEAMRDFTGHFTRADHLEVDERKNNRSMRISDDDRYQEMPRQMKINIDRCRDTRRDILDSADLKTKAKPNYQNALTSF
ncbi:hypothetical protein F2Q68_00003673 [Brassica cretica]|uniref:Uncharacterized protein n=1 Tax=Brassica cretica TaxID=69181 RepID=A0A8S9J8Q9_BRACR|nr:hypothetical protein F2Q68_00003673 [Brassica cretica]